MYTKIENLEDHKNKSVANAVSQNQKRAEATFQFVDNRPEAIAQRKLQKTAGSSAQVKQFKDMRNLANDESENIIQRLAIGNHDEYGGYLNGDGMIRNPANVGYFVGLLRAGLPVPNGDDPMTASEDIEMIATPDDEAQYLNAEEYEGDDQPATVTKSVLNTGHHRFAAFVEEGVALPPIANAGYAMHGYHWSGVPGADYDLQDADIPNFNPVAVEPEVAVADEEQEMDVVPYETWLADIQQRFQDEYADTDVEWGDFDAPFAPEYESGMSAVDFYNQYISNWAFQF